MHENTKITYEFDSFNEYLMTESHTMSENIYKMNTLPKNKVSILDNKSFIEYYNSYELIPIEKAVHLWKIFIYILNSKKFSTTTDQFNKIKRNCKTISYILNGIQKSIL